MCHFLSSSGLQLSVEKEYMGLQSSGCNKGLQTQITKAVVSTRLIFHGWQTHIRMPSVAVTSNYRRLGLTPASRQGQRAGTEADLVFVDSHLVLWLLQLSFSWLQAHFMSNFSFTAKRCSCARWNVLSRGRHTI